LKKNKSIVLYNQPHKGLSVPRGKRILIIGLSPDENENQQYYINEIKVLKENNKTLKDIINKYSGRREELKYLKDFRKLFSGRCEKNNITMTIIQCTEHIRKEDCRWKDICKTRNDVLNRLSI